MSNDRLQLLKLVKQKAIENARNNFLAYVRLMGPVVIPDNFVEGKHLHLICDALQKVESGESTRLMIFMPPRSSKSRLGSILFPSWVLGRHAMHDTMVVSYSKELAIDFSREVRNLVKTEEYLEVFPEMGLKADSKAAYRWQTTKGGVYTAGGIKSGIAGKGAHVAIIDDPLSEQEAVSEVARKSVHQWYPGGLRSRLAPGGKIVVISTRWHNDDLCGWLLKQEGSGDLAEQWDVLEIPALIETESQKKLFGYDIDTSYWPERWSTDQLKITRGNMPPHQWNALYQQHPNTQEGGIFKDSYFQDWTKTRPPKCQFILQTLDTSHGKNQRSDFSVIQTWGIFHLIEEAEDEFGRKDEMKAPHLILLDSQRGRWQFDELFDRAKICYQEFKPDAVVIEDKASGQTLIQEMERGGIPVIPYNPDKDKVSRAYACQPVMRNGRVWLRKNKKKDQELLTEALEFPYGANDDQVDAMTQGILYVRDNWKLSSEDDWFHSWKEQKPMKPVTYWSAVDNVANSSNVQ